MITPEIIEQFFPKAVEWVTQMEKAILQSGHRLSAEHRKDAGTSRKSFLILDLDLRFFGWWTVKRFVAEAIPQAA
jgi:hypothetical protein